MLRIKDPKGAYRARIQNIPRATFTTPFLLSLHLYFDAPSLEEAQDIADDHLSECMSMLAFSGLVTGVVGAGVVGGLAASGGIGGSVASPSK